jgi:hypothetical protein
LSREEKSLPKSFQKIPPKGVQARRRVKGQSFPPELGLLIFLCQKGQIREMARNGKRRLKKLWKLKEQPSVLNIVVMSLGTSHIIMNKLNENIVYVSQNERATEILSNKYLKANIVIISTVFKLRKYPMLGTIVF